MCRDAGLNLHGIIEVADYPRRFSRGGVTKTWVIGIAHNALDPWQGSCWGHGFIGKVAWDKQREKEEDVINCLTEQNTVPTIRNAKEKTDWEQTKKKWQFRKLFWCRSSVFLSIYKQILENCLDKLKERSIGTIYAIL